MDIEFDPKKDVANLAKHGISLAATTRMEIRAVVQDNRFDYGEDRFKAFGLIEQVSYCLTFTPRGSKMRAISLRRARAKEYADHVVQAPPPPR